MRKANSVSQVYNIFAISYFLILCTHELCLILQLHQKQHQHIFVFLVLAGNANAFCILCRGVGLCA